MLSRQLEAHFGPLGTYLALSKFDENTSLQELILWLHHIEEAYMNLVYWRSHMYRDCIRRAGVVEKMGELCETLTTTLVEVKALDRFGDKFRRLFNQIRRQGVVSELQFVGGVWDVNDGDYKAISASLRRELGDMAYHDHLLKRTFEGVYYPFTERMSQCLRQAKRQKKLGNAPGLPPHEPEDSDDDGSVDSAYDGEGRDGDGDGDADGDADGGEEDEYGDTGMPDAEPDADGSNDDAAGPGPARARDEDGDVEMTDAPAASELEIGEAIALEIADVFTDVASSSGEEAAEPMDVDDADDRESGAGGDYHHDDEEDGRAEDKHRSLRISPLGDEDADSTATQHSCLSQPGSARSMVEKSVTFNVAEFDLSASVPPPQTGCVPLMSFSPSWNWIPFGAVSLRRGRPA